MTPSAQLGVDMVVHVRAGPPEPHCRTPFYLRGKTGRIVEYLGCFRDPSLLAYHKPGLPMRHLFRVQFNLVSLWTGCGPSKDQVFADLYEHWLEPVDQTAHGESGASA